MEDSFLSSQPGGDHRPHSPLLSQSLEAMAEDLQEVQGDTSEYTPLLSESLEASLPPYVPTSQGGSSTTLTPGATDSSGPDTVHHPWQPKVLPSDAERIQAWTHPPCARCTRQASWNVFRTRFTLCPTSLSGLDCCAHQVAKPILVWPPEGWALLNPKERLETHLHLVAILEAGWYPNSPDGSAIPSTVPSNSLVPPSHRWEEPLSSTGLKHSIRVISAAWNEWLADPAAGRTCLYNLDFQQSCLRATSCPRIWEGSWTPCLKCCSRGSLVPKPGRHGVNLRTNSWLGGGGLILWIPTHTPFNNSCQGSPACTSGTTRLTTCANGGYLMHSGCQAAWCRGEPLPLWNSPLWSGSQQPGAQGKEQDAGPCDVGAPHPVEGFVNLLITSCVMCGSSGSLVNFYELGCQVWVKRVILLFQFHCVCVSYVNLCRDSVNLVSLIGDE